MSDELADWAADTIAELRKEVERRDEIIRTHCMSPMIDGQCCGVIAFRDKAAEVKELSQQLAEANKRLCQIAVTHPHLVPGVTVE